MLNVDVAGTCLTDCANVGLADGDGIGGSILVDDALFTPGGVSGNAALRSYSFAFGNFSFSSAQPSDPGFAVRWGATRGSVAGFLVNGFVSNDPAAPGPALILDALLGGGSVAAHQGYRRQVGCCNLEFGFTDPASLSVDGFAVAPVPVPSAVLLLAGGLAGLAGLRSRRRPAEAV